MSRPTTEPSALLSYPLFLRVHPEAVVALDLLADADGTSRAAQVRAAVERYVSDRRTDLAPARAADREPLVGHLNDTTGEARCRSCAPSEGDTRDVRFDEAWTEALTCNGCSRALVTP